MNQGDSCFDNLYAVAKHLREQLKNKKYILLYAHNGTGKTRLSMLFKELGKQSNQKDTLYFNAFTEDLFTWDNDLSGDTNRVLQINSSSQFISGLEGMDMENSLREFLHCYTDFNFRIDYTNNTPSEISFYREIQEENIDNIKISRGEEHIFIWCFFLVIVRLVMDGDDNYKWVKYIYIDDPISSLDENNAISVAINLAQMLKDDKKREIKIIISSHHTLFFNVLHNVLKNAEKYFLSKNNTSNYYNLSDTKDTPFFYHVVMLKELVQVQQCGEIYPYHFNILRSILEKTASFHGFTSYDKIISPQDNYPDDKLHKRMLELLSHGNYSLYEPQKMSEENKSHFKEILNIFLQRYPFNPELVSSISETVKKP
jgi:hypothetical protein